jgi:two-component system cell cycle sensor histidine kinase/response regulator CckA
VCHEQTGAARQWAVLEQCSAGWVAGLVARAMDVRERRQLADRLERAERLDSIGRLAGGLAHDFNNCLTTILCHVDMGLAGTDGEARAALAAIGETAMSAARLSRELLTAGRAQPITLERLDLAALVASLTTRLSSLMPPTARLEVVAPGGPVWIRGDAGALERVVLNLVTNAADAVADGGHVRVAVRRAAASGGGAPVPSSASASIEVTDTGVGMDASVQARLFEPFFTTKASAGPMAAAAGHAARAAVGATANGSPSAGAARMSRANGGTGLGLATAFGLISQHGGTITVESAPRQGSRFTVLLPTIPGP